MWHAILARKELLECLFGVSKVSAREGEDRLLSVPFPRSDDEYLACWKHDPSRREELPFALVCGEKRVRDTLALLGAAPQLPTPLSAFCRVIPADLARSFDDPFDGVQGQAIDAMVGAAVAESAYYSSPAKSTELSVAACKRTLAFSLARALRVCPPTYFDRVGNGWFEAQAILNPGTKFHRTQDVGSAMPRIMDVASRLYFGMGDDNPVSVLLRSIIETGEPSEHAWKPFSAELPAAPSMKTISDWSREERVSYFQSVSRDALTGEHAGESRVIAAALVATRIAPGSFEHLAMVSAFPSPRVALWYGFFAALQRGGIALRTYSGLGYRVRRDVLAEGSLYSAPSCDISLDELQLISGADVKSLSKRFGQLGEVSVELAPMVECSFKLTTPQKEAGSSQTAVQSDLPLEGPRTVEDRIRQVQQLLSEISREISTDAPRKPQRQKPRPTR
jgi:hypothetical protein